ncbi:MAG: RES family NAD+ phosphorylase [Burkholderiales bacterium]
MADNNDIDDLKAKRLCYHCVGENYLCAEIKREGKRGRCSYCQRLAKSYTIEDMAERIDTAFEQHFIQLPDDGNDDGEPVVSAIENAADISEEAAADIQAILEDKHYDHEAAKCGEGCKFASNSYYEEKGVDEFVWQEEWRYFERSLKAEARFFSRIAAAHLAKIFGSVDKMSTTNGKPLVVDAGPDKSLSAIYRARVFQSVETLKLALCRPDEQLGSPSMIDAAAGRMNARGISVFYGANEPAVAIAEVRPPVGSQVAVARFDIIRSLRLLDLTALSSVREGGSIFDFGLAERLERTTFLRSLTDRIARPVMPDDEAFDYLITQAIADFLATENDPLLDGIVFPSVQATDNALNIVLFHKAARVKAIEIPNGTEIKATTGMTTEEGWEPWYSVSERVPANVEEKKEDEFPIFHLGMLPRYDSDVREATLQVDLISIKVHAIQKVKFDTVEHEVHRHRTTKTHSKF